MEVLGHTDFDLTMEIYAQVSSQATCDALKRMGKASTPGHIMEVVLRLAGPLLLGLALLALRGRVKR